MTNEQLALAYQAAYRAVGLTGDEVYACARYRNAVDAALVACKPFIEAGALRAAANDSGMPASGRIMLLVIAEEVEENLNIEQVIRDVVRND